MGPLSDEGTHYVFVSVFSFFFFSFFFFSNGSCPELNSETTLPIDLKLGRQLAYMLKLCSGDFEDGHPGGWTPGVKKVKFWKNVHVQIKTLLLLYRFTSNSVDS